MSATLTAAPVDLDAPYALAAEQIRFYRENGFVKLKNVFGAGTIARYGPQITRRVHELNTLHLPMEERTTYQKAFLQVMNLWTKCGIVKDFVFSKRLARIAAELMGTSGSTRRAAAASRRGTPTSTIGRWPRPIRSRRGSRSRRRRCRWVRSRSPRRAISSIWAAISRSATRASR